MTPDVCMKELGITLYMATHHNDKLLKKMCRPANDFVLVSCGLCPFALQIDSTLFKSAWQDIEAVKCP